MERPQFKIALLHPRYWLTWLFFLMWFLLVQLPYPLLCAIAWLLSKLFLVTALRRRRIAERNIELCFPEMSAVDRKKLIHDNFYSMAMALPETGMAWFWPQWRLRRLFKIQGLEHLNNDDERGVILMAMHFSTLDIGGAFLNMCADVDAMYRPHKNPVYDYVQRRGRERHSSDTQVVTREDVRGMVRRLKQGRAVWYAPDQDYGPKQSVFVPFFGVQAATVTATGKFARLGNARIVPFVQHRLPRCRGYEVTVYPELDNFPTGEEEADAVRINRFIEQRILEQPEQYMWVHRRFKTRPPGEPKLY
ncbi:MAG: lipid A biosynthesis lauroyl acyltransferase [Candidatus Pelagadaptatus aseana]|uniref:LpxL/LpxP family Kdo(2)-lipid IV(A) lauroyl/palmitoleoyl acyltransferase n=1 Tax=Candidatus Pelagadaptatus aseana TaxID=3120508 RepID=UPI0039B32219